MNRSSVHQHSLIHTVWGVFSNGVVGYATIIGIEDSPHRLFG